MHSSAFTLPALPHLDVTSDSDISFQILRSVHDVVYWHSGTYLTTQHGMITTGLTG
jgi:5'-3' exonuclease